MTELGTNLPEFSIDYDQRVAAEIDAAVVVITGGPTSGKSRTLVARMAFLLDAGVEPDDILCVTATKNAANNLRHLMNSHPRVAAVGNRIFVASASELPTNLVRSSEMNEGLDVSPRFTIWTDAGAVDVMRRVLGTAKESGIKSREIRDAIAWARHNRWSDPNGAYERDSDVQRREIMDVYQREKRWQRAMDVDDLILQATAVVGRSEHIFPDIPRPFHGHVVVDGVEDFSRAEIELLEQLAKRSASLTLTVDENQRVRGRYPGAKIHGICPKDRPPVHHHLALAQAGTAPLAEVARRLRSAREMGGLTEHVTDWDPVRGPNPRLVEVPGTKREMALLLVKDVIAHHEQGVRWEEMAILCRNEKAMMPLWTLLAHGDIPYRVIGRQPVSQVGGADCVQALLTCVVNPRDLSAFCVACGARWPNSARKLSPECGGKLWKLARELNLDLVTTAEIHLAQFEEPESRDLAWLVEAVRHLQSMVERPECDLMTLFERAETLVLGFTGPGDIGDSETATDFRIALLRQLASKASKIPGRSIIDRLARFLDMMSPALGMEPETSETAGLTVCTWDACKSQYWRVVFVLDVGDETIPGRASGGRMRYQQRLWYTITTRATRELVYYCLKDIGQGNKPKPSRFIDPLRPVLEIG